MFSILKFEMKVSFKQLLIWALSVGGMGFFCVILYKSMESSMAEMANNFASMGSFSAAFGMDKLSIATIKGYFATEIGTIHSLGSAMFAASIATVILSKEEDGHTTEFIFTLPVSRVKIIIIKYLSVLINVILFTCICSIFYLFSFFIIKADGMGKDFFVFMLSQLMMNIEVASICFMISAISKKNKLGVGIGVALVLYFFDMMARVIPDLKDAIIITPFSYSNAADIFTNSNQTAALAIGLIITLFFVVLSGAVYGNRDLNS